MCWHERSSSSSSCFLYWQVLYGAMKCTLLLICTFVFPGIFTLATNLSFDSRYTINFFLPCNDLKWCHWHSGEVLTGKDRGNFWREMMLPNQGKLISPDAQSLLEYCMCSADGKEVIAFLLWLWLWQFDDGAESWYIGIPKDQWKAAKCIQWGGAG